MTVAIIGAGVLGRSFAVDCARAGFTVILEDLLPAKLRNAKAFAAEAGIPDGLMQYASTVEAAVREADIVVDFVPDELESKLEIFSLIDRMAPPKTVICTPTEAMSITDLASCTYRAERCIAIRDFRSDSPRLTTGPLTSPATVELASSVFRALGKKFQVEEESLEPVLTKNSL